MGGHAMRILSVFLLIIITPLYSFAGIINVPSDFATIQEAIDASVAGDSILVAIGTYHENIVIDKTICLIGQSPNCTIIEGDVSGDVVLVKADSVVVKKFTITGAGEFNYDGGCWDAALKIDQSDHCLIESCFLRDNITAGLVIGEGDSSTVQYCHFSENTIGIMMCANFYPEVPDSITLGTTGNKILHNQFVGNLKNGLEMQHTLDRHHLQNIVYGNYFFENQAGIRMIMSQENEITYNSFIQNSFIAILIRQCTGLGNNNLFHNNSYIDNSSIQVIQAEFFYGSNYWYSEANQQGNYWSDYSGEDLDADGIGDTPVDIYECFYDPPLCQDMYPLMQFNDSDADGVMDVVDNCPDMFNPDQKDENLNGIGNLCDLYIAGDANSDLSVNIGDGVYLINFVFRSGPAPEPLESGDANYDGDSNVGDAVYLINYVFKSGMEPCCQ